MVEYEIVKALADILIEHSINVVWPIEPEADTMIRNAKPLALAYLDARPDEAVVQWVGDVALADAPQLAAEIIRRYDDLERHGPDHDGWAAGTAGYYLYLVHSPDFQAFEQQFNGDDPAED